MDTRILNRQPFRFYGKVAIPADSERLQVINKETAAKRAHTKQQQKTLDQQMELFYEEDKKMKEEMTPEEMTKHFDLPF